MKTIKIITITILIFHSLIAFSQDCEYIKNEVDIFTKDTIVHTKYDMLAKSNSGTQVVRIQGIKINQKKYLRVYLVSPSIFSTVKGKKFLLLDENKNVYTFDFNTEQIASNNSVGYVESWYIIENFQLDSISLENLINNKFIKLRYYTQDHYVELDIKSKHSKNINKIISCL